METWSRGTNSRLPFDVNVTEMLNLSFKSLITTTITAEKTHKDACSFYFKAHNFSIVDEFLQLIFRVK